MEARLLLVGERKQRFFETIHGWVRNAGPDHADAGILMGNGRIDDRQYSGLDHFSNVDASRYSAEIQERDSDVRILV